MSGWVTGQEKGVSDADVDDGARGLYAPGDERAPLSGRGVAGALRRLVDAGAPGASLLVRRGAAWFMVSRGAAPGALEVEAAPSRALPREHALSPERANRLRQAGFSVSGAGQRTLSRAQALGPAPEAADALAAELLTLFDAVYGEASVGAGGLRLRLGAPDPLQGEALIARMTEAAKASDPAVGRTRLYRAMLEGALLLLVDEAGAPSPVGALGGMPVFATFSDYAALRRHDPRAPAHARLEGRALFPLLMTHGVGSLLINPAGPVGGELYRNEVQTIADACYRGAPRARA